MDKLIPEAKHIVDEYVDDIAVYVRMLAYKVDKRKGEMTNAEIIKLSDKTMEEIRVIIEKRDELIARYSK